MKNADLGNSKVPNIIEKSQNHDVQFNVADPVAEAEAAIPEMARAPRLQVVAPVIRKSII